MKKSVYRKALALNLLLTLCAVLTIALFGFLYSEELQQILGMMLPVAGVLLLLSFVCADLLSTQIASAMRKNVAEMAMNLQRLQEGISEAGAKSAEELEPLGKVVGQLSEKSRRSGRAATCSI